MIEVYNGKSIDESMKNPEFEDTRISEINCSERNCELRIQALMPYLEMETPEETKRIVNGMIDDLKSNRGKGFGKTEALHDNLAKWLEIRSLDSFSLA